MASRDDNRYRKIYSFIRRKAFVTATAYDSASNNQANVNAYIISVSTTQVVIGFSAAFTGEVHYHAIQEA